MPSACGWEYWKVCKSFLVRKSKKRWISPLMPLLTKPLLLFREFCCVRKTWCVYPSSFQCCWEKQQSPSCKCIHARNWHFCGKSFGILIWFSFSLMVTLAAVSKSCLSTHCYFVSASCTWKTEHLHVAQFATEKDYDAKCNLSFPGKILKKDNLSSCNFQLALQTVKKWY